VGLRPTGIELTPQEMAELNDAWTLYLSAAQYDDLWDAFRAGWQLANLRRKYPEMGTDQGENRGVS
jgi:hypothetical protein